MQLIDHVSITVRDLQAALPFYKAVMQSLEAAIIYEEVGAIGFGERNDPEHSGHSYISVFASRESSPDSRRHYCFKASSADQVRAFHAAALANGGSDAGAPGLRDYHETYFAAFVFDPEGNKLEAVCHCSVEGSTES